MKIPLYIVRKWHLKSPLVAIYKFSIIKTTNHIRFSILIFNQLFIL